MAVNTVQAGGFITTDNVFLYTWYTHLNNQLGLTSMAFRLLTASPLLKVGDLAYAGQVHGNGFAALLANDALILGARVIRLFPVNEDKAGVASNTAAGTAGATPLPSQTTGIISYYSGVRGRPGRARQYIPFPATDSADVATGLPSAAYIAGLQTFANFYSVVPPTWTSQDGLRTATADNVIWHRATLLTDSILSTLGRNYWATQRRRGDLGRANPPVIPL